MDNFKPSIFKRRKDFHGLQLIGMTGPPLPYVDFPDDFHLIAPYFSNNQTYDMTNLVHGVYIDVLRALEHKFNFTTKLYMRKDQKWGIPSTHPNGTVIIPPGILQHLNNGSAEFIVAGLTIIIQRLVVVDYLPIISSGYGAIYIPTADDVEGFDFKAFLVPFNGEIWLAICVTAVVIAILGYISEWIYSKNPPVYLKNVTLKIDAK